MISVLKKATYVLLGVSALMIAPLASSAQELKIGFVNTERIFREATPAKAATAKLEQEFSRRDKDLQDLAARVKSAAEKLDKDAPVISDAQRVKRQRELSEKDKD
ncbi:MAG: OmpH family outer membrane protein [Burkholderiaceae bacterium]